MNRDKYGKHKSCTYACMLMIYFNIRVSYEIIYIKVDEYWKSQDFDRQKIISVMVYIKRHKVSEGHWQSMFSTTNKCTSTVVLSTVVLSTAAHKTTINIQLKMIARIFSAKEI